MKTLLPLGIPPTAPCYMPRDGLCGSEIPGLAVASPAQHQGMDHQSVILRRLQTGPVAGMTNCAGTLRIRLAAHVKMVDQIIQSDRHSIMPLAVVERVHMHEPCPESAIVLIRH